MTSYVKKHLAMGILSCAILATLALASCTGTSSPVTAAPTRPATATVAPIPPATDAAPTSPQPAPATAVPFAGGPLLRFASSRFAGSGDCAVCHSLLTDSTGQDVSMDTYWRSTMMANSARDPLWQAKVSSEVARNPGLKAVIEAKCATCHMPMAYTQALTDDEPAAILGDGFRSQDHALHALAMDGVSCTLCHQIQDLNLGQEESFGGHYPIDTQTAAPGRPIFGPFPRPFQQPMRMDVGFTPVEGRQTLDSGLCATCHTLYTPYVDAQGNVLGTFPEQTPYLEWEHSTYGAKEGGRSCQQCHMPAADGAAVISNRPPGRRLPARSPFAQHDFVGGNTFMLGLLKTHGKALALTAGTTELDATLARTVQQLATATAELSVAGAQVEDGRLSVVLVVSNEAGHKFPSGFPSRRAWIHLTVLDARGDLVFSSGAPQDDGRIAGNDADHDGARFEPHYDLISSPEQVQVYEAIMQNSDGEVTYTLLRAATYGKDNRLLPLGFDKGTANEDIAVYGAAAGDESFVGGSDHITYQIDVEGYDGPFTVHAELLYQSVSYRFAQDLCQGDTPEIESFCGYYRAADHTPAQVASVQQTVR